MDQQIKILIVEDEYVTVMQLQSQLCKLGYTKVFHAASGENAIETARLKRPDLIVMDIRLIGDMD